MQQRLIAAGQRPISVLVDITNYLMLAFGRPAHAYDLAKLNGAVVARRARDGEQVMALNEKTYTLDSEMTVIADDNGVHDIAGIMGGEDSGCSDETQRRPARNRLFRSRADRRDRPQAGAHLAMPGPGSSAASIRRSSTTGSRS